MSEKMLEHLCTPRHQ